MKFKILSIKQQNFIKNKKIFSVDEEGNIVYNSTKNKVPATIILNFLKVSKNFMK